jgi:hypothetical protein
MDSTIIYIFGLIQLLYLGYASARTSRQTRATGHLCMLLRLPMCAVPDAPRASSCFFFEHTPPLATTAPHTSYYIAPTRESMCVGSPSHMREREHSARTLMRERESTTHVPQCERDPSCMRERGIITRVPQYAREKERAQRACPMREREGAQRACTCVETATCSTMRDHVWWCRGA